MADKNLHSNGSDEDLYQQKLSALVDNETQGDLEQLLQDACYNDGCKATWQRYHLVRDVMQRDYHPALAADFSQRVSQCLLEEDEYPADDNNSSVVSFANNKYTARSAKRRPAWLPVAGLGLAASVAAAGIVAWQLAGTARVDSSDSSQVAVLADGQNATEGSSSSNIAPQPPADAIIPTVYKSELGTRWLSASAEPRNLQVEKRLNSLLINHLEDSTMGRVQGMLAHTRVVAYDSVPGNESF